MNATVGWYLNELVPYLRIHSAEVYPLHMAANAIVELCAHVEELEASQ